MIVISAKLRNSRWLTFFLYFINLYFHSLTDQLNTFYEHISYTDNWLYVYIFLHVFLCIFPIGASFYPSII